MGKSRINNDSDSKYNALDLVEISKYNFYRVLFLKYYRFIFHTMCSWDKSQILPYPVNYLNFLSFLYEMRWKTIAFSKSADFHKKHEKRASRIKGIMSSVSLRVMDM